MTDERQEGEFLTGSFLVALPGMGDPRFSESVILLSEHSETGAMGFIVNKPLDGIEFSDLAEQLDITASGDLQDVPVLTGGPVERQRGFVLHSPDYAIDAETQEVNSTFSVTAHADILRALASGEGPVNMVLALGYAGWGPGQLEDEIRANAWLVVPSEGTLVFDLPAKVRWTAALTAAGVDPAKLSGLSGSA
ncbi:MAG: YqgE/AlgH family protein [Pseudomonadota bacterium]